MSQSADLAEKEKEIDFSTRRRVHGSPQNAALVPERRPSKPTATEAIGISRRGCVKVPQDAGVFNPGLPAATGKGITMRTFLKRYALTIFGRTCAGASGDLAPPLARGPRARPSPRRCRASAPYRGTLRHSSACPPPPGGTCPGTDASKRWPVPKGGAARPGLAGGAYRGTYSVTFSRGQPASEKPYSEAGSCRHQLGETVVIRGGGSRHTEKFKHLGFHLKPPPPRTFRAGRHGIVLLRACSP